MRVGISAEFMGARRNGIATHLTNLLHGLVQVESDHQFSVYLSTQKALPLVSWTDNVVPRIVPPYHSFVRLPFTLPAELLRRPIDVLHSQQWGPPWAPCPTVLTVHDLGWERHPEIYPWALRTRLSLLVRHSARRAVRVITPSHYTAEDVVRLYGIPERKIRVVYGALNTAFAPVHNPDERERVRRRYHLPDEYLLYVGSIEPKKNVHRLIEAFAALRRTYRVPHKLVIAGKSLWLSEPILKLPAELGIEHEVLFTGQVPDEDLAPLYTGATALAFLGMYEGFGYPPFEAMACGTPAIVANRTSLAELTGGAAVQVDPDQQHEVVAGLLRLLTDDALRDDLRQEGLRRLRDFQPAPLARQLIGVYEECLAGVPQPRRVPAPGTAQHREEDMV